MALFGFSPFPIRGWMGETTVEAIIQQLSSTGTKTAVATFNSPSNFIKSLQSMPIYFPPQCPYQFLSNGRQYQRKQNMIRKVFRQPNIFNSSFFFSSVSSSSDSAWTRAREPCDCNVHGVERESMDFFSICRRFFFFPFLLNTFTIVWMHTKMPIIMVWWRFWFKRSSCMLKLTMMCSCTYKIYWRLVHLGREDNALWWSDAAMSSVVYAGYKLRALFFYSQFC